MSGVPGVKVVWAEEEEEPDKGGVYVLDSFDRPQYNTLLNKCRLTSHI